MQVWDLIQRLIGADLRGYDIGADMFEGELNREVMATYDANHCIGDIKAVRFENEVMIIEVE